MKAVVAAFNQEKALVGAFSVITNLRMKLFEALEDITGEGGPGVSDQHQVVGDLGLRHPGLHPQLRVPGEAVHGDLATQRHQPLLNLAVALLKIKGLLFSAIFAHLENISMQFVKLYSMVQRF